MRHFTPNKQSGESKSCVLYLAAKSPTNHLVTKKQQDNTAYMIDFELRLGRTDLRNRGFISGAVGLD